MELTRRAPMQLCDCYMTSAEGIEFQKILESEDVGLAIYRHSPQTQDALQKRDTTGEEVFVLKSTKSAKVTSQDLAVVFEQNVVSCPRCLKIIERAENFLKDVCLVEREDVMGVCDHCIGRQRPLSSTCKCQDIVDKFLLEDREQRKQEVKAWLKRVQDQLKKTTLDTRQLNKLETRTRSELSLNTAISKFSKSDYKHFAEDRPESQLGASHRLKSRLPRSAKAISSLDSLHVTEKFFKPKEFDNLFSSLRYPKQKYDNQAGIPFMSADQTANKIKGVDELPENVRIKQVEPTDTALPTTTRKLPQTQFPESVFIDPQEYIKRVISPDAADDSLLEITFKKEYKTKPSFFKIPEDKQLADKVLEEKKTQLLKVDSFFEVSKELKPGKKRKRSSILKSYEDEKVKTEKREPSTFLLDGPAPDRGKRKLSSPPPPPPPHKHSKESFLKDSSEKDISRVFSFSFPKVKVAVKKLEKRHASSSELIKNTQDMLQAKAEEEKRKKEEELRRKREEEERKKLEREKRRKQALAAKNAKSEEEEKDKRKLEEEKRKSLEEEYLDLAEKTLNEKPVKPKTTPVSPLSINQKSDKVKHTKPSEKTRTIIDKEALGAENGKVIEEKKIKQEQGRKSTEDKSADQGKIIRDKRDKQKDDIEKDLKKAKPDKKDDQEKTIRDKGEKQKDDIEKDLINELKKTKPDKKDDQEKIIKDKGEKQKDDIEKDLKKDLKKSKPDKKDDHDKDGKQTKPDTEKKVENEPTKTKEPKEKNDKLEDNTLKALLLSQQKEKQEQEKMLREQQKEEELARKKAMEAAKSGKSNDKKVKDEAANKLKKLKEMAEEPEPPPPPKKKEEVPNTKELTLKEVKMKRPSTDDLMLQLVKLKLEEKEKKVNISNLNPDILQEHGIKHTKHKRLNCIICADSELSLDFEELMNEKKKAALDVVLKDVIIGEKIFKFKAPFNMPHDEPFVDLKEIQETQAEVPKPVSSPTRSAKKNEAVRLFNKVTKYLVR